MKIVHEQIGHLSLTLKILVSFPLDETIFSQSLNYKKAYTVKLGDKEQFDKEQIGVKEPFPVTNLPI